MVMLPSRGVLSLLQARLLKRRQAADQGRSRMMQRQQPGETAKNPASKQGYMYVLTQLFHLHFNVVFEVQDGRRC